jgi:Fe2+ transport system protein FeoA
MKLTHTLKGKTVKVKSTNFVDKHINHKITNIGITENTIIDVLDYDDNNRLLHLLIYGVEYVLREKDCKFINVSEYQDNKQFNIRQ